MDNIIFIIYFRLDSDEVRDAYATAHTTKHKLRDEQEKEDIKF